MIKTTILLTLAALLAVPSANGQEEANIKTWIESLGSRDIEVRREAAENLSSLGRAAIPHLETALEDAEDPEVRWNARWLLKDLRHRFPTPPVRERGRGQVDRMRPELDRLRREMDELMRPYRDRMETLDDRLKGLRRMWDDLDQVGPGTRLSYRRDGDGAIRVEIQRHGADGQVHKKVYEADSAKAFAEKYPDVVREFGLELDDGGILSFGWPSLRHPRLFPDTPLRPTPDRKRLGVLAMETEEGLVVLEVEPGTLAAKLGVQKDDILRAIDGHKVHGFEDVRDALRRTGYEMNVDVERKGEVTTLKKKPEPRGKF